MNDNFITIKIFFKKKYSIGSEKQFTGVIKNDVLNENKKKSIF
jgi:hypothetical protein